MLTTSPCKRLDDFFNTPKGVAALCLGLFALTAWTFLPALDGGFLVHDDYAYVQSNPHVNSGLHWQNFLWALSSLEQDNWHPMTWLSHMLDVQLYGLNPWGHHLTSVLLHALNTMLVFLVFRKMTGAVWRSFFVAGLFGLHPLRVESVAWISERKDVLSTFFGLLTLIFYVRYAQATSQRPKSRVESRKSKVESPQSTVHSPLSTVGNYALALLYFALGLMSKTMLVTLPFVFLLLDYWPLGRVTGDGWRVTGIGQFQRVAGDKWQVTRIRQLVLEKVPFFALSAVVSTITYIAQARGGAMQEMIQLPLTERYVNAVLSYTRYLGKFFWPQNLCCYYPHPVRVPAAVLLPAVMLVIGLSLWAWLRRRQSPYLFVGWCWYVGTLVPVIGLVQLGSEAMADRYSYIPLIGINLLLVWGGCDWVRRWRYGAAVSSTLVTVALATCIYLTKYQIGYWKDNITVWSRAITVTKNNYVAHNNLGGILVPSDPDLALLHFQEAVRINPRFVPSQRNLADLLYKHHRYSEAIPHIQMAMELEPQNSALADNLAILFSVMGRVSDAIPLNMKAVEIDPQNPTPKYNLQVALFSGDHEAEAMSNFLATARSDPGGIAKLWEALQFDTNHFALTSNLAWVFATYPDPNLRDGAWAVRLAKRACEITGYRIIPCVDNLAVAYAEAGQFDDAVSTAQRACTLASAANQPDLLKSSQELLALFRAHQPFHQPAK